MLSVIDVHALLEKDEEDLWALLGAAIDPGFHLTPREKENLVSAGRAWYSSHLEQIKAQVCPHPIVRRLLADTTSDDVSIVATICGLISPNLNPLIAAGVSVLIVKRGLSYLCEGYSSS